MKLRSKSAVAAVLIAVFSIAFLDSTAQADNASGVAYRTVTIDDVDIFYREAGDPGRPTILLLHGFPTSSHMYRDLITELADEFHLWRPITQAMASVPCQVSMNSNIRSTMSRMSWSDLSTPLGSIVTACT